MITKEKLAKEIESAVEWLMENQEGCSTIKLDDVLAVCVGWSDGYAEDDSSVIHAKSAPTWCINAAIKVWTSDSMRTDLDWINSPYYSNGNVWDDSVSISPSENYISLADWFLKEYDELSKLEIESNGKIIGHKTLWVCEHCLEAIESREGHKVTLKHEVDEDNEGESICEWCENTGFNVLYELI